MHIFVIGGGPAGLTAAITAARNNIKVTIVERNSKIGKKLLLTGNGRCNFWNDNQSLDKYHSNNMEIFNKIFNTQKNHVVEFIESLGVVYRKANGYYYPFSNQSTSILKALYNTAQKLNIEFITDEQVLSIKKEDKFIIKTNKTEYHADKVILACGSTAAPKTGSDGNGYELAKSLGHTIIKPLPSLVQLYGNDNYYKDWEGVRSDVILSLYENNHKVKEEQGEIQFTNYGISGICTFNLSGIVAKGLDNSYQEKIKINFVPWIKDTPSLISWLDQKEKELDYTLSELLECFLNYKLVNLFLKLNKIPTNALWRNAPKEKIANLLLNFPFHIKATNSFEQAQVCSGGVPLTEINPETMESLKEQGLYIVGEMLDVDGDCGGYNLGFAWMSGLAAGKGVNND